MILNTEIKNEYLLSQSQNLFSLSKKVQNLKEKTEKSFKSIELKESFHQKQFFLVKKDLKNFRFKYLKLKNLFKKHPDIKKMRKVKKTIKNIENDLYEVNHIIHCSKQAYISSSTFSDSIYEDIAEIVESFFMGMFFGIIGNFRNSVQKNTHKIKKTETADTDIALGFPGIPHYPPFFPPETHLPGPEDFEHKLPPNSNLPKPKQLPKTPKTPQISWKHVV